MYISCNYIHVDLLIMIHCLTGADWRLLVISKRTLLGSLPGNHEVYRIDRVAVLTLSSNESPDFELDVSYTYNHHLLFVLYNCIFQEFIYSKNGKYRAANNSRSSANGRPKFANVRQNRNLGRTFCLANFLLQHLTISVTN